MQTQSDTLAPNDLRWTGAALLRITIGQLREWEAEDAAQGITLTKADEEAWEGTEIDVNRRVL